MITFHLGRSGQTWPCAASLARKAREEQRAVFVLVPRQYTLSAERMLMRSMGADGFFDLDVLSPGRFAQRVFSRAGGGERVRIDARGKAMAVSSVLTGLKESLSFYASAANRQGLCDRVSQMIAEYKQAGLSPKALEEYVSRLPAGAGRDKLSDLAALYGAYEELLCGRFVDGEDVQEELISRIPLSPELKDAQFIVCGFDVLTETMGRIALALSDRGPVDIVLCDDMNDPSFEPVTKSVARFTKELSGVRLLPVTEPAPFPEDLAFLEKHLLDGADAGFPLPPSSIRLYAAPTPYAEACHAAEEMLVLWAQGVPFSDMAVLCGTEDHYFPVLEQVLTACRIPHHLNRKLTAAQVGPAAFLLAALRAVAGRYYPDDVIRCIKSGYMPLSDEEAFFLENYILAYGIRGQMFTRPFTRGQDEAPRAEELRERFMAPLEALSAALKNAENADQSLTAVFSLLENVGAYGRMTEQARAMDENGRPEEAAQLTQVWKTLMDLLDQMHELSGGRPMTGVQAAALMEAGLTHTELSALPQSADSVVCGLIGSAALNRPDHLFVMGLNDGLLSAGETGLLTDEEKAGLEEELQVHLSLNKNGRLQLARLDVYKAMTNAGKRLYLSHAQALQDGTALRPLSMLSAVRALFPLLVEEGGVTAPQGPARPMALASALEAMPQQLRKGALQPDWTEAWHYLCEKRPEDARRVLDAFRRTPPEKPLPPEITHRLFMDRVTSVHRVEAFAVCPMRHFIQYGLKPQERREWALRPADTGSFYHRAVEGFTRLLPSLPNWPQVTRQEVERLMDAAAQDALDPLMKELMKDSHVQKTQYRRFRRLLSRVGWTFTQAAQHSAFRPGPDDSELRFGYDDDRLPPVKLTLSDGSRVMVRGVIDRVERFPTDNGELFRVIDFKSAKLSLDPNAIFWGVQLQLLIYMKAVMDSEKDGIPCGAYYFRLADPLLTDPGTAADVETKLAQALSLSGITLKDAEIVRLMDDRRPPVSMPPLLKADGSFLSRKAVLDYQEMCALMEYVTRAAAQSAEGIYQGIVHAAPLALKGELPCARCPAREACRYQAPDCPVLPRVPEPETFDSMMARIAAGDFPSFFDGGLYVKKLSAGPEDDGEE